MPWPTPQEYNEAIQHPALCFADADLQAGFPDLTPLGLPRPITGNFASVYRLRGSRDWAVRCFFREYADSSQRYAAISAHLAAARLPHAVEFQYLQRGIRVGASWFPVLKMQWVEGTLLGDFVAANRADTALLRDLAGQWLDMLGQLERHSIAHGDLQHGNVLVVGGRLRLVDYDGMFVPSLGGRISHEVGHPNYQHPARTGHHFGAYLDRFSGWVVYLSLVALQRSPSLWDDLSAGDECLLFRRLDFAIPQQSPALQRLRAEPGLQPIAEQLERILALPPTRVPPVVSLESTQRTRITPRASRQSALPDWLEGEIPPPPPRRFVWPRYLPRFAALIAAVSALVVLLAVGLSPAQIGVVAPAVDLSVIWLVYMADPAVAERTALAGARLLGVLRLRSLTESARLADRRVRRAERRHARILVSLDRRRDLLDAEYQGYLATAGTLVEPRLLRVDDALRAVRTGRRATEEALLQTLRDYVVERQLRRAGLLTTSIKGLGWQARVRLWLAGVRTAHHVSGARVAALQRLAPSEAAAVLRWRVSVERQLRQRDAPELPRHLARFLDHEYSRAGVRLERRRRLEVDRAVRLTQQVMDARDVELARLDRRRNTEALRRDRALQRHAATLAHIETSKTRVWAHMDAADDRMEVVRHLTFRRYVAGLIGLDRSAGA